MREFEVEGAIPVADLPSLARTCDVIMICVPTSADVRQALFGQGGLAEGLSPGKIVVDQTTGDPVETRSIAVDLQKLGVALVDAPIASGAWSVAQGTVAMMCGGPSESYEMVRAILETVSPNIVYCGQTGNGHLTKLVHNAVASCNRLITYESIAMGFKYGLSLEDMANVINKSSGWNGASERILPVLASGGQTATFRLDLMVKDLRLASRMAMSCGAPMLIANTVRSTFETGMNELGAAVNLDDMAHLFETMANIKFGSA
jgi:3-hydroxyisobutyrate dehydrogenase